MAKYEFEGKKHNINLMQFDYTIYPDGDNYVRLNWEYKDKNKGIAPSLEELLKFDKDLRDENTPLFGLYLYYTLENEIPVVDYLCYEKGHFEEEVRISLNKSEKALFQKLLNNN